jgi:tetratricopeptide (TPR) repeat protein
MIGREAELVAFDAATAEVAAGGSRCVLITGEAGVGKTRLVREAIARSGLTAFAGASPATVAPPYEPVSQILRAAVRRTPGLPAACGPYQPYLAALLPELGPSAPDITVGTLVEALRRAFAAAAGDGPVVIVFDDLHWASEAMQLLLPQLADALRELPLLLVMLARDEVPDDTHRLRILRAQLRRICEPVEVTVRPLGRRDTARLAAAVLGEELEGREADMLHERTQGIPFYIEEMAGMLALSGSHDAGRLPLPETILDAVLLRTDVLSRPAREALETAAVAGASCEVAAVPGLRSEEALTEALAAGFLVEAGPGIVAFRHVLVRDAIYHAIPWTRRQILHAAQARALEAASAPASERATHWLGAGDVERARTALCEAAAASAGVHAYRDAARLYERALELGGGLDGDRFDLLERLAVCSELAGDLATSARAWREVIDGRRGQGEVERVADAQQTLGRVLALRGSVSRALDAWLAAADGFRACGRGEDAARSWLNAASVLHTTGSLRPALNAVRAAIAACPDDAPPELPSRARAIEGVVLGKLGETERALAAVEDALSVALAAGAPAAAAVAYRALAAVYENAGDFARAGDAYEVAIDYCGNAGLTITGTECSACLTHVLRQRGEWRRSLSLCRTLLDDPATDDVSRAVAAAVASQIHASRGDRRRHGATRWRRRRSSASCACSAPRWRRSGRSRASSCWRDPRRPPSSTARRSCAAGRRATTATTA